MMNRIQRRIKQLLCLLLVFSLGCSSTLVYAASKETKDKIDQVQKEKEEAEAEKKKTEQEQNKLNNAKSEMEAYLQKLSKESHSLNEQVAVLDDEMEVKEEEVASKEAQVKKAQQELDQQYADMKLRIRYLYENDQSTMQNLIEAVLSGGITGFLNQVEYTVSVNQYDRSMLEEYKEAKKELDAQYEALQEEKDALALLKEETEKKKQQVAAQQKATGSKVSEYETLLAQKKGEITDMAEYIQQKTDLLNRLIAQAAREEAAARLQAAQDAASSMGGTIIAGDAGISRGELSLSEYEIMLLAVMIYCEAGNQGMEGQLAVGYVIMNRVRSSKFPNSLEAVLRQSRQFEPVGSGRFDLVLTAEQDDDIPNIVTQSCWNAARAVVNGTSNVGDSLFFRTWAPVPTLVANLQNGGVPYWIIKDHIFYYYWTSYSTGSSSSNQNQNSSDEEDEDLDDEDEDDETPGSGGTDVQTDSDADSQMESPSESEE